MEGNLLAGSTIQGGSYGMLDLQNSVSYLGEDAMADCHSGGRRKFAVLQKKGKWRSVSEVLAERGCYASPQHSAAVRR